MDFRVIVMCRDIFSVYMHRFSVNCEVSTLYCNVFWLKGLFIMTVSLVPEESKCLCARVIDQRFWKFHKPFIFNDWV